MTPDQIIQLRTLLMEIQNNDLPRIHTAYAGGPDRVDIKIANARWDCSQKIRQALTLLPCSDCQPCKRCGGINGKHRQVDDPQAGNSNMLTKMQCPLDNPS